MIQLVQGSHWDRVLATVGFAFQPIVNIQTGVVIGMEALLRNQERAGFASIDALFNQAWEDGVLHPVDLALREKVLDRFRRLSRSDLRLFYNLDSRVLMSPQYRTGHTLALLRNRGLSADTFCFEISEKHECGNSQDLLAVLQTYRQQGFHIAMDDYGAGFSGLQLLYNSEPDYLKIDRFFIQNLGHDTKKQLFVNNIIKMAHQMSSGVIAEGVETCAELRACRDLGCDLVQGYFIERPTHELEALPDEYPHLFDTTLSQGSG